MMRRKGRRRRGPAERESEGETLRDGFMRVSVNEIKPFLEKRENKIESR